MPIFEFRCERCDHVFELLWMPGEVHDALRCPRCDGEDLQRVPSAFARGTANGAGGETLEPRLTSRSCSGGSCDTITLPGHVKSS